MALRETAAEEYCIAVRQLFVTHRIEIDEAGAAKGNGTEGK